MSPGTSPPDERTVSPTVPASPRVEREVQQGLSLCLAWLDAPLREALRDTDRRLFAIADASRNHLDQQHCFESRAILEREGPAFRNRFAAGVAERFRRLGAHSGVHPSHDDHPSLSLLDASEQEQAATLFSMASRAESRSAGSLFELGYRMAVLAGAAPLEGTALPFGPRALVAALEDAAKALTLPAAHRIILYQAIDAQVLAHSETFYEALNGHYLSHGILPGFRIYPTVRVVQLPALRATGEASSDTHRAHDATSVLEGLRTLLADHVEHDHGTRIRARLATSAEWQAALHALQGKAMQGSQAERRDILDARTLHDELLAAIDRTRPAGAPPASLTELQDDTVTLVALLFDNLARELPRQGPALAVLGSLQWSVLRSAMDDRRFFDDPTHPARQLLDTVSRAAQPWLDPAEGEADEALSARLERLMTDAGQAQTIDPAWREDIEQHLAQLTRKAHVAERRQIEAMEGRDRLERARQHATELMAERMTERNEPRGVLRILLERTWTDVLALHLLRGGETGESFLHCLGITEQLLAKQGDPQRLRHDIERGLEHLGMSTSEAAQVVAGVFDAPGQDTPSQMDIAMRLKQRPRLGEGTAHGEPLPPVQPVPLDPVAQAIYEGFARTRFGTWFEFRRPDGRPVRRKLAWFSPPTARCLLVDSRGVRVEDMDLTRLATQIARGDAREWNEHRTPPVDRAWRAVARHLRRDGAHSAGHA